MKPEHHDTADKRCYDYGCTDDCPVPPPPWDEWDDYAQCYGCNICGAAEGYRIHNPNCIYNKPKQTEQVKPIKRNWFRRLFRL